MPKYAKEQTAGAPGATDRPGERLEETLRRLAARIEAALEVFLPSGENYAGPVVEAMRYSLLAPGKRVRPALTLLCAELCGKKSGGVIEAAAAVEMIHTASLILDDLPCMDDSALRRGRETLHHHAGEATAILAADALLMQGFNLIGRAVAAAGLSAGQAGKLVIEAADCVGVPGMIGGQWRDLNPGEKSLDVLEYIHSHKTGRLFTLSATLGARLAGTGEREVECLAGYAKNLGLAFQIIDDILNFEAAAEALGKDSGSDSRKVTFVTAFGIESARKVASELVDTSKQSLAFFGARAGLLLQLADYVYRRKK